MVTTEQKLAVVDAYVRGFEAGDAQALANLFADNASLEDPVGTPVKNGRAEIDQFYVGAIATGAKLAMLGTPRCAGDYVAFPFTVTFDWEGERVVIEVIDTFQLNDDGKITEMRAYWGPENMTGNDNA
ncbi:nuclear transport factor 2 family protein [Erythrobacter alti]|uniref:nuclear transport factor 2 family protein n=1 Tax=Erythrobacter alti TaxID=1896145 RepID=UPI0030F46F3F